MIIIKNTKIYILCPAQACTGGPELLHQLADELKSQNYNASILYIGEYKGDNPIHSAYKKYDFDYTFKAKDEPQNILIVPEIFTNYLKHFKMIQKVIWWLSIDNYYNYLFSKQMERYLQGRTGFSKIKGFFGYHRMLFKYWLKNESPLTLSEIRKSTIENFAQSYYAIDFLKEYGITNVKYLSDFLNEEFIRNSLSMKVEKRDIVAYNPAKGAIFTEKLINRAKEKEYPIQFVPIKDMTRQQVCELLSSAKIYIDFGEHPGKDRIPREAAISGCIVFTNLKGSAKFYSDVMIPDQYKIEDAEENLNLILERIMNTFENYEKIMPDFEAYKNYIASEQNNFVSQVKEIFGNTIKI